MSRQTILVYLPEQARAKRLLDVALALAERHDSHLIGVYVVPPIPVYPMIPGSLPEAVFDGHIELNRKTAKAIEKTFNVATQGRDCVAEWRKVDSRAGTIIDTLIEHARCADVVIAPFYDTEESENPHAGVAEELAMGCGRPVIFVPESSVSKDVGKNVTVAWDGSREATRAVFDSVDLLKDAEDVRIVSIDEESDIGTKGVVPAAEIAEVLARRGVSCEVDHVNPGALSVGEALLARIGDNGSDLLVMGIYGHSKLREFVFGGATRSVLKKMTIPVLMSR